MRLAGGGPTQMGGDVSFVEREGSQQLPLSPTPGAKQTL